MEKFRNTILYVNIFNSDKRGVVIGHHKSLQNTIPKEDSLIEYKVKERVLRPKTLAFSERKMKT